MVKAKYPEYADIADEDLGRKVQAKYPEYSDFVDAPDATGQARQSMMATAKKQVAPAPAQPGFGQRLYENTIGGPASLLKQYGQHIQENSPKWGMAAGLPAMGQTAMDMGRGISNGFLNAAKKTGAALKQGDIPTAMQQAPGMVPLIGPPAVQVGEDVDQGNLAGAAGGALGMGLSAAVPGKVGNAVESLPRVGAAMGGALKEGAAPIHYGMHKLPIPAVVAGAAGGRFAGEMAGPIGAKIGGVVGGAVPLVRGAMKGWRESAPATPDYLSVPQEPGYLSPRDADVPMGRPSTAPPAPVSRPAPQPQNYQNPARPDMQTSVTGMPTPTPVRPPNPGYLRPQDAQPPIGPRSTTTNAAPRMALPNPTVTRTPAPGMPPAPKPTPKAAVSEETAQPDTPRPSAPGTYDLKEGSGAYKAWHAENAKAYNVADYLHKHPEKEPADLDSLSDPEKEELLKAAFQHGQAVGNVTPKFSYRTGLKGSTLDSTKEHLANLKAGTPKNVPVKPQQ